MTDSIDTTTLDGDARTEHFVITREEHDRRMALLERIADLRRQILESRGGIPISVEEIDEALGITRDCDE